MSNLFGSAATELGCTAGNKHLVEMRAGKMYLKGHTVYPDNRKGLLYMYQSEDTLMHFCWRDRTSGVVEDDLTIFPDCEYVRVTQCTTGRVYLLRFKSTNRKFFFWLQEPRTDKDEDHCNLINEYLSNPVGNMLASNAEDEILQSLLNMSQFQLMQLLRGGQMEGLVSLFGTSSRPGTGGSARTNNDPANVHRTTMPTAPNINPNTAATVKFTTSHSTPIPAVVPIAQIAPPKVESSDASPIQLTDLQNYFQGISPTNTITDEYNDHPVDLSTALTFDALRNNELSDQLHSHLPVVDGNVQEQLCSTLESFQFQKALSQCLGALESDQRDHVVSQLATNRDAVAANNQGNIQECMKVIEKALETSVSSANSNVEEKGQPKNDEKKDDDGDEEMQLD